jgi:tetratricopeptide (TPR) repeat protein
MILAIGALAYINSFEGAFVYDDVMYVGIPDVQQLWPPWPAMFGKQNASRPLIGLSLAINYSLSGIDTWSYHLFNLLVHLAGGLALFGIVRRTLLTDPLRERFGEKAFWLALVIALLWVVHPLQTQSVTYIIQRCESLMGMFYLVTLYCAIRSHYSEKKWVWTVAAVAACLGGMMSKQVMVTAPLMVMLYDRMFLIDSFKEAARKRWALYTGLCGTWAMLIATTIVSPVNETAGFAVESISPLGYFVSEFKVIIYYLRLALWPDPLVIDYRWPKETSYWEAAPYGAILILLGAGALWALIKRRPVGYAGAWFFAILSVTSSFIPYTDLAFEHRMYLPLAAVLAIVVLGSYAAGQRLLMLTVPDEQRLRLSRSLGFALVAVALTLLVLQTLRRNVDYRSQVVLWTDAVSKRPENDRAHTNLGKFLKDAGRLDEALMHYQIAYKYNPTYVVNLYNLGNTLIDLGRVEEGKAYLEESLRVNPDFLATHYVMGNLMASEGKYEQAARHFERVVRSDSSNPGAFFYLAQSLEKLGRVREAIDNYNLALRLKPDFPAALSCMSRALASEDDSQLRKTDEAVRMAEKAVDLTKRQDPFALESLALALAEDGQLKDAVSVCREASSLASRRGEKELAAKLDERAKLYSEGRARPAPLSTKKPR